MVPAVESLRKKDQEFKASSLEGRQGGKEEEGRVLIREESKKHRRLTGQDSHLFIPNHGGFVFYLGLLK